MLALASTSDKLQLVTSAAATTDVHASWVDFAAGAATPGRTNTVGIGAATTDIVAAPAASTVRSVKTVTVRNRHATTATDVTLKHTDGTNAPELVKVTLAAGWTLHYDEHNGCTVRDDIGRLVERIDNLLAPSSAAMTTVILGSDVTNNNASANTIADVTGLSFSVTAGQTYWFRAMIMYTSAATSTGSRWSVNGPASPTLLIYKSEYSLTTTSRTINEGLSAYDSPAASNATSAATASNIAWVEGFITPSASGTFIIRFASEVSSSAIVAKAGSILQYQQVL